MKTSQLLGFGILLPLTAVMPLCGQSIFSVNALGYADVVLRAGSNYVSNPFNSTNNSVAALLPNLHHGSYLVPWDGANQTSGPTNTYSASTGWSDPAMTLRLPEGAVLWSPQPTNISFSGEIFLNTFSQARNLGYYVLGVIPRVAPYLCSDFAACQKSATPPQQTMICRWNPTTQQCVNYTYYDFDPTERGWYDTFGNKVDIQLAPGESALFFVPELFYLPSLPAQTNHPPPVARLSRPQHQGSTFRFDVTNQSAALHYVLRATNVNARTWPVVLETNLTAAQAIAVNMDASSAAFYRVIPHRSFGLFNQARTPGQFSFQFFAPSNGTYVVERRLDSTWDALGTLSGVSKGIVGYTHSNAVAARAEYRVRFNP